MAAATIRLLPLSINVLRDELLVFIRGLDDRLVTVLMGCGVPGNLQHEKEEKIHAPHDGPQVPEM